MVSHVKTAIVGSTGYLGTGSLRRLLTHPHATVEKLASATSPGKSAKGRFPGFGKALDQHVFTPMTAEGARGRRCRLPRHAQRRRARARPLAPISRPARRRPQRRPPPQPWRRRQALRRRPHRARRRLWPARAQRRAHPHREARREPRLLPHGSALALLPLAKAGLIEEPAIVTAMSGVSGAGKEPNEDLHFPEMNESARAYKVGTHRHKPRDRRDAELCRRERDPRNFHAPHHPDEPRYPRHGARASQGRSPHAWRARLALREGLRRRAVRAHKSRRNRTRSTSGTPTCATSSPTASTAPATTS